MSDLRKNTRITHQKEISITTNSGKYSGKSINISKDGMLVDVTMPESYHSVKSISFKLPLRKNDMNIPCKIIKNRTNNGQKHLGVLFDYKDYAQMLLIDQYIKELKENEIKENQKENEFRQIPRVDCLLYGYIYVKGHKVHVKVKNISSEGVLVEYRGKLLKEKKCRVTIRLDDSKVIKSIGGKITYIVQNEYDNKVNMGIYFDKIGEIERVRIRNFVVDMTKGSAVKKLCERLHQVDRESEYIIKNRKIIERNFKHSLKNNIHFNVILDNDISILDAVLKNFDSKKGFFELDFENDYRTNGALNKYAYFSYNLDGSNYYFRTEARKYTSDKVKFKLPKVLYQAEKRSYQRKISIEDIDISVKNLNGSQRIIKGKLIDIGRRGFLCELEVDDRYRHYFSKGKLINYSVHKKLGLDKYGEIRHVKVLKKNRSSSLVNLGIEIGIKRKKYEFVDIKNWNKMKSFNGKKGKAEDMPSMDVEIDNSGKQIASIINYTSLGSKAPVLIIPPAFGKKKELLSPLAYTLFTNFRNQNKNLVVIRYDGINMPGQSYNEIHDPKRGYEMLNYRLSQGCEDLEAVIRFAKNNQYFHAEKIIVASFSMSSLESRKLAASKPGLIDFIFNVMGVPSAQSAMKNIMGGVDVISNYKMNIPNGVSGVMGYVVDTDKLAEDFVTNKFAFLSDARHDMSKIDVPVIWMNGKNDGWIDENEIRDVMSVKSRGLRKIIRIPTGHNLTSSEDAVKAFKILSQEVFKFANGKKVSQLGPDRDVITRIITYEREKIEKAENIDAEKYWEDYLIGDQETSFGYDFYRNIQEFKEFLSEEARLIDFKNGEKLIDMGCGTGIFIESLLGAAVKKRSTLKKSEIYCVDLVRAALNKTQSIIVDYEKKYKYLIPRKCEYIKMNLEPNRFIPVKEFLSGPAKDANSLRNRVPGLKNSTVDKVQAAGSNIVSFMAGRTDKLKVNKKIFTDDEVAIVKDINKAARFILRKLNTDDIVLEKRNIFNYKGQDIYEYLTAKDINFEKLDFDSDGINLNLKLPSNIYDKIVASLFISYLFNPDYMINEFYRIQKPGGKVLVSSVIPDNDISKIFTKHIDRVIKADMKGMVIKDRDKNLAGARSMLNDAADLLNLGEDGYFKFYGEDGLINLLKNAGYKNIKAEYSLGKPGQVVIVTGIKPK